MLTKQKDIVRKIAYMKKFLMKYKKDIVLFTVSASATCVIMALLLNVKNLQIPTVPSINKPHFSLNFLNNTKNGKNVVVQNQEFADTWTIVSRIHDKKDIDFTIVDMRSQEEYRKLHMKETVNVPYPYVNPDKDSIEAFIEGVKKIKNENTLILMPYSMFSTTGDEAQMTLRKAGITTKLLTVGWNELYNLPNMWAPESSWDTFSVIDLIEGVND